jgi:FtsP/CotA-like multicopper oxidase with cupredoxin domain
MTQVYSVAVPSANPIKDVNDMRIKALTAVLAFGLVACGGDAPEAPAERAAQPAAAAALTTPDWFQVDHDANTVQIQLVAGSTNANNYWNFQGFYGGRGAIVVPEGYTVTITLENRDPNMGHSVGVGERRTSWPGSFSTPITPVFEGALTSNPTSMTESTMPGESETITFVASQAGDFALVCYVVGHASAGMWMPFTVSADGEAGVRN